MSNIHWQCLRGNCSKNCCSKDFDNGNVLNIYNMHHDQIPLLRFEKEYIVKNFGAEFVRREVDGMYYINSEKHKACPFYSKGSCSIQDHKPLLCRSYPLIQLDAHVGPIFDHTNCPGFDYAEKHDIPMQEEAYIEMLESFIRLQQYRLSHVRLELRKIKKKAEDKLVCSSC